MAKYRLSRKDMPEVTLSEFLAATGLNMAQMSDLFGWSYDTLKCWSVRQGPANERDRQLLGYILKTELEDIKALLRDLNR